MGHVLLEGRLEEQNVVRVEEVLEGLFAVLRVDDRVHLVDRDCAAAVDLARGVALQPDVDRLLEVAEVVVASDLILLVEGQAPPLVDP